MNNTPEQPRKEEDGQATDTSPDRAQPDLTEQTLVSEQLAKETDPDKRNALEGDLEDMADDIEDANSA